jgi:hypothetical protein
MIPESYILAALAIAILIMPALRCAELPWWKTLLVSLTTPPALVAAWIVYVILTA